MNITDPQVLHLLQEGLKWLPLSPKNQQLFRAYIFLDQRDDAMLANVEPQNNLTSAPSHFYLPFLRMCSSERDLTPLARMLEFIWAAGGVTIARLLGGTDRSFMCNADTPYWRAKVLGAAPAALLSAYGAFSYKYVTNKTMHFLYDMARECPNDLREALALCTTDEDHAFALIAAALVHQEDNEWLREELVRRTVESVRKIHFGMPMDEVQAIQDYIRTGDTSAPVPLVPSVQHPATDTESAMTAMWLEFHFLRTYAVAALLTAKRDPRMRCALRFYMLLDPRKIFRTVLEYLPKEVFRSAVDVLTEELPGGGVTLLLLGGEIGFHTTKENKELLIAASLPFMEPTLHAADSRRYMSLIPYTELRISDDELREKIAVDMGRAAAAGGEDAVYRFVTDQGSLSDAVARLRKVKEGSNDAVSKMRYVMSVYIQDHGIDDFALRCMAYIGMVQESPAFDSIIRKENGKVDSEVLSVLYRKLLEAGLPAGEILKISEKLNEHCYWDEEKSLMRRVILSIQSADHVSDYAAAMKKGSVFLRGVCLEMLANLSDCPDAKAGILTAMADGSKQIREQVSYILSRKPEWAGDIEARLTAKKASERIVAVEVLGKLGRREVLSAALAEEKNTKVADAILAVLGSAAGGAVGSAQELAEGVLKGGKIKKLAWLPELHKVRKADGSDASDDIRNAILVSYCDLGRIGRSDTAAELAKDLDKSDLQKLAVQVYDLWFAAGAQSKQKWVLPFAAVFGGEAMTDRLRKAIGDWPEHQRGAIACDAVMALALSTDPAAIVIVDSISRKFKFRQVKAAAAAALENAAKELGITAEELADRIVPDLGFGRDGKRVFDYGKRSFTVRLTPTLELEIVNDQGKAVKSMPAPGKTDDPQATDAYEAFKSMKKQIKTTITSQRARLEAALSVLRCWDVDRWTALFVDNPIMHQFAISLIWGVYEDGRLTDTFRYMEDGTFNTVDEEEYTLPENAKIGLVHPVELDEDTLEGWKQQLEDYEIKQSIDQLSRTVHTLDEAKAGEKALEDFGGMQLNGLSLSGKLLQQGWYRGSIQDGGVFYCFYREDATLGIGAELRFSGSAVGYDDGENVTVYEAIFYTGTIHRGSYVYDTVPGEQILRLGDVPVRYYSEIIHQLKRSTASSTERSGNWKSERKDM